jgi:Zn-dependent peptidase ImmA (M78 family)
MTLLSKSFRKQCEVIAAEKRMELDLRIFDRLPANQLASKYGIVVRRPDEINMPQDIIDYFLENHDWWGVLFPVQPPIIVYDPKQSPARYESTIMHELAHIILCHPTERICIAPDGSFERDFSSTMEAEAAYLGGCLQIPRRGLLWAVQKGKSNQEIARHFGASLEMVRWRQNAVNPKNK